MTTTRKISFDQQSKCVTASVSVESDDLTQEQLLQEAQSAFDKAKTYADLQTMRMQR